jgi:hypothetical protein
LFVLESPEVVEGTDFLSELLANDGFDEEMLSGDELLLANGERLEFDFTDDNSDETLIIKTNERTYDGFSEATTYFSVTNTSKKEDEFTVQAYFPDNLGEVESIEVFNQNKPREMVVPEYRPFVYHCEAGWDFAGDVDAVSIEELSQQLSETVDVQEIVENSTSSETTSEPIAASTTDQITEPDVEFALPSTTDASFDDIDADIQNTTTTVLNMLPSMAQLLQFSTTAATSVAELTTESESIAEVAPAVVAEELLPAVVEEESSGESEVVETEPAACGRRYGQARFLPTSS